MLVQSSRTDLFKFSLQYDSKSNCSKPVTDGIAKVQTSISGGEDRIIRRVEDDGEGKAGRGEPCHSPKALKQNKAMRCSFHASISKYVNIFIYSLMEKCALKEYVAF